MSHITEIQTKVRDLEALTQAVLRLGGELVVGQKEYRWYSRTPGKCDHAIRFPGAKYEIGIVKQGADYALNYDDFQSGGLQQKVGRNCGLLIQSYALEKTKREARRMGSRVVSQTKLKDGSVRLVLAGR